MTKKILIFSGRFFAIFALSILFQQIGFYILKTEDSLLFFPSMALATFCVLFMFDKNKTEKIDLGLISNTHGSNLHGILIGAILISLSFFIMKLLGALQIVHTQTSFTQISNFIFLFFLFFIVAFQEELFFRGYLHSLADNLFSNPKTSILITAILFSCMHAFNPNALASPLPLFNIFLAGLLLGIFRLYSNGIWMPIGFHWSWNLLQGFYGFQVSGISIKPILKIELSSNHWLSGGQFGAEGSMITTFLLVIAIAGYGYFYTTIKKRTVQQ